jgi:hypothetical protein
MLVLPPIRRRIPASHRRASLCSIGAGFMELVISRGTFNPENHELEQSFEYSFNLLGTFIYCWINEVKYVGKRQIVKIEQLATKQEQQ